MTKFYRSITEKRGREGEEKGCEQYTGSSCRTFSDAWVARIITCIEF